MEYEGNENMIFQEFTWQWVCLIPRHSQIVEKGPAMDKKVSLEIELEEVIMCESDKWFNSEIDCRAAAEANCDFDYPSCWGLELRIKTRELSKIQNTKAIRSF